MMGEGMPPLCPRHATNRRSLQPQPTSWYSPTEVPYSWKYWWKWLGPKLPLQAYWRDLDLVFQYKIAICIYYSNVKKLGPTLIWQLERRPPNGQIQISRLYSILVLRFLLVHVLRLLAMQCLTTLLLTMTVCIIGLLNVYLRELRWCFIHF